MSNKIISREEIEKTAQLARLALTEEEKDQFAQDLNNILEHFKSLNEVEVEGAEKVDVNNLAENQLRSDEAQEQSEEEAEKIRTLFPERNGNYLKVKSVL